MNNTLLQALSCSALKVAFVSMVFIGAHAIGSGSAYAEDIPPPPPLISEDEIQPKLRFSQPSDEMDFTVQPVPEMPDDYIPPEPSLDEPVADEHGLYGFEGTSPSTQDGEKQGIDQFFSTTTIISPDKNPQKKSKEDAKNPDELKKNVEKPKAKVRTRPSIFASYRRPPHKFDSVHLPSEIYHRKNSQDNKHLPFAYYTQDQILLLKEAVLNNDPTMLRALFKEQADIHHVDEQYGTLVHLAVQHHKPRALRWLLMYRVDPNQLDAQGLAPIHYAAYAGNLESVELLLTYGADKHISDASGKNAAYYAVENKKSLHTDTILSMVQ